MKVLVAHNRYRSATPSGENVVVDAEIAALREAGVDVVAYLPSSDDVEAAGPRGAVDAARTILSREGSTELIRLLWDERPDVLHVHNVYPSIGPGIISTAQRIGIGVVMTVHNFRLDCVNGLYFRDGRICTDCRGRSWAQPAVTHACYRGSRAQSLVMAKARSQHRRTWDGVDRFLVLTDFHAEFLRGLGIADERIVVRPTSAPDPGAPSPPGRDVLYVGRLGTEKGVEVLLEAWSRSTAAADGRRLHVVGDGELMPLALSAAASDSSIVVHGSLDADGVAERMRDCGVVVIPSVCFEGLPRVLVEAMARGRGVIGSDLGGVAAEASVKVPAGDPNAWASQLTDLADRTVADLGVHARQRFVERYAPPKALAQLLTTYHSVATG